MSGDKAPAWELILIAGIVAAPEAAKAVPMRKPAKPITRSVNAH